ncbi:hypothetical protein E2C01_012273 [Portunus trituberculatus]|uniref:Uncharacterized protein n=1 Tax=Portunus trituberculatus TaxID=210409 RepID=A0A5B7DDE6_PORTR|nr:hypothetical protein [Portunus trituberculatus]
MKCEMASPSVALETHQTSDEHAYIRCRSFLGQGGLSTARAPPRGPGSAAEEERNTVLRGFFVRSPTGGTRARRDKLNFVFLSVWSLLIPHILGCHCQLEDLLEAYRSDQRDAYQPAGVPQAPPSEEEMNALAPSSPRSGAPTDSQSGLAPQAGSSSGSGPHSPNTGGASSPLPPASHLALSLLLLILVALPPLPTGLL